MRPSRDTLESVEREAYALQERVLEKCVLALRDWSPQFWVFVHLRSIALSEKGRRSVWKGEGACAPGEEGLIEQALDLQYQLEPELRTYNELLISRGKDEAFQHVSFSFGSVIESSETDADTEIVHFSDDLIAAVTENLTFPELFDAQINAIDDLKRSRLAEDRLSLGLDANIREKFNLGSTHSDNPLRALPDEVRYSLQVLMLWSNTLKWKYIETHHSPTQFDALSGLVITICSCSERLGPTEVMRLKDILQAEDKQLDVLVRKKTTLLPRDLANESRFSRPTPTLENRLSIRTSNYDRLWEGRDAFYFIELLRRDLFAATFEGTPESYSFMFGHPGFIARPVETKSKEIKLRDIRQYREWCEGALDGLNVVDVLGKPNPRASEISLVPIAFPVWAAHWDDTEQALGAALEKLSSVHREMIVVGMICRNVITVFKDGELVCSFDGAWKEIRSWKEVVEDEGLKLPSDLAAQPRLMESYHVLSRIAYGPLSRSIILGYARTEEDMNSFVKTNTQGLEINDEGWVPIGATDALEPYLMRASKTDGAILMRVGEKGVLYMRSRVRVVSREDESNAVIGGSAGGTGTATARSMAKEENGILSIKVSRDGGMKLWWNGQGPLTVGTLVES